MQKTVLITGASSGFGRLAVDEFLRSGWRVLATMRKAAERRELFAASREQFAENLVLLEGDITQDSDRQNLVDWIRKSAEGRLDALVNNAGFGLFGSTEDVSEAQIRYQMEVNYFGTLLLTRSLLPALRQAKGVIVTVSSIFGLHAPPFTSGYCASKFAVEGWMESLAGELRPYGIDSYLVEPGGFPTRFGGSLEWPEAADGSVYKEQTARYKQLRQRISARNEGKDPRAVSKLIHSLVTKRPRALRHAVGADAKAMIAVAAVLPKNTFSRVMNLVFHKMLHAGRTA